MKSIAAMIVRTVAPPKSPLTPDDVVRAVKHLPSAPKVLPRLKQLLRDGNSAVHEIVALIRFDSGIVARVLQVSNSAYFGKGARCLTVEEAVGRVGYDQVYELVSYAVASQVLVRPLEIYGIDANELWKMSVACALAAESLAQEVGEDGDVAYTIGLLHSVGMVAIDEWALHHARQLRFSGREFPRDAIDGEYAALGFTQAEAGGALLRDWTFPTAMVAPVRWQYQPHGAGNQERMACLLHVAKWLRSAVCAADPAAWPELPEASCLQRLSLESSRLEDMVALVAARLTEVSSLLETGVKCPDLSDRVCFPSEQWSRLGSNVPPCGCGTG